MTPVTMDCVEALDLLPYIFLGDIRLEDFMEGEHAERRTAIAELLCMPVGQFSSYAYLQAWIGKCSTSCEDVPSPEAVWKLVLPQIPFKVFEQYFHDRARALYECMLEEELLLEDLQQDAGMRED